MVTRIQGWGRTASFAGQPETPGEPSMSALSGYVREVPQSRIEFQTSAEIIDQAVEQVIAEKDIGPVAADSMRRLMSNDMASGAANAYFSSMANRGVLNLAMRSSRRELVLQYVLTDEEMNILTRYAPEYKLVYRSRDVHDHPLAAGSRIIDRDLVYSRLPLSGRIVDVGSAVVPHVMSGTLGTRVHACRPLVDVKDPSRWVQDKMKITRMLGRQGDACAPEVRASAQAFLERHPAAVCGKPVEQCDHVANFIASVHVYDVKMSQWASIIERHGASVVEGCMLFSPQVFEKRNGVMEAAGARYEVDPEANVFRMGFVGSPAWWYEHDWVEYLKYGVDQILVGEKAVYSYKIVERRGDTIFFRILPVGGRPLPQFKQVYCMPGVPMVDVSGFATSKSESRLSSRRKVYTWPLPLWQDMLTHATVMVDRGALDYERLFNYYRTVAPRQSINTVVVSGGYTASLADLAPLIANVALAATVTAIKTQVEVSAHVDSEMKVRHRSAETTLYKMAAAFGASMKAALGLVFYPFNFISAAIDTAAATLLARGIVDWEPQVRVREISAKLVLAPKIRTEHGELVTEPLDDVLREAAPFDHIAAALRDKQLAQQLLVGFYDDLPADVLRSLEDVVGPDRVEVTLGADGKAESIRVEPEQVSLPSTSPPTYRSQPPTEFGGDVVAARVMAIKEAISQCETEMRHVQSALAQVWRDLVPSAASRPRLDALKQRAEEFRDPMFWWIENGVVVSSLVDSTAVVEAFEHSAVYTYEPDPGTGSSLRPVFEEVFEGLSQGEPVRRVYTKIADSHYTGWGLTNASVVVYNGPELISAMELALTKDLSFETKLVTGPPGCGKTHMICQEVKSSDAVFAPAKKVIADTRQSVASISAEMAAVAAMKCRTVDSYLVNYTLSVRVRELTAERLMADEAFMAHSGRWWACAALLGVKRVWFYGDPTQIPPVVRAGAPKVFLEVQGCDEIEKVWMNWRNPASAVAAWGHLYDWKVRAKSQFEGALLQVDKAASLPVWPGQVMLGFYQADKKEMHKLYASLTPRPRIATVHEVQGETLTSVKLHRFDFRKRSDKMALFDNPAYVLVAMSRHKENFAYISPKLGDVVQTWVAQAQDPRRVQAAAEVETCGVSKEYI